MELEAVVELELKEHTHGPGQLPGAEERADALDDGDHREEDYQTVQGCGPLVRQIGGDHA